MEFDVWIVFAVAAFCNIIMPGPAIVLAISNGVSSGVKSVIASSAGNVFGLFVLANVSILGLELLLKSSAGFFLLLKILGAAYLIYLGVKRFRCKELLLVDAHGELSERVDYVKKCKEAFFVAVTNPKAILFFTAFFPIFMDSKLPVLPQFFVMTLTFMVLSFLSLVTYGSLAKLARAWFANQRVIQYFHRLTGSIFVGFGMALLQVKQP